MTTQEIFGHNVKRIRKRRGFTQVMLAKDLNVSSSLIAHIETNKCSASFKLIDRMCVVLGVTPDYLFKKLTPPFTLGCKGRCTWGYAFNSIEEQEKFIADNKWVRLDTTKPIKAYGMHKLMGIHNKKAYMCPECFEFHKDRGGITAWTK